MIVPSQAIVRPRAFCPETGEALPLDELVESFFAGRQTGAVGIVGPAGSGKSTALKYLSESLAIGKPVVYLDDASYEAVASAKAIQLVVCTSRKSRAEIVDATFELSPWDDDDLIEYLLATRPDRCQSVLSRIRTDADRGLLRGSPELWQIVLDRMVADDSMLGIREILDDELNRSMAHLTDLDPIYDFALRRARGLSEVQLKEYVHLVKADADVHLIRLLEHPVVNVILASVRLYDALVKRKFSPKLFDDLPNGLMLELAKWAGASENAMTALYAMLRQSDRSIQSTAASVLHATGTGWKPIKPGRGAFSVRPKLGCLESAQLAGAKWRGVDLFAAELNNANLSAADLRSVELSSADAVGCRFTRASLQNAEFVGANLRHADFRDADCTGAVFTRVDLSSAKLTHAKFVSANFRDARLLEAQIEGADFSDANFTGAMLLRLDLRTATISRANFCMAKMVGCNLEGVRMRHGNFFRAELRYALLSNSIMPRAIFREAYLRDTGLAGVEWERADLRDADLQGASFHFGSSRSGLVGSPIASEGSRTGFYTDEFDQQGFKSPEEIRKANLRGADLRGAKVRTVDFYLVDLRNAKYTAEQAEHFRRCGAILSSRRTK